MAVFCLLGEDPPVRVDDDPLFRSRLLAAARDARAAAPERVTDLIGAMLATDPGQRPTDTLAWAQRLTVAGGRRSTDRARKATAVAAGLVLLAAGGTGVGVWRTSGPGGSTAQATGTMQASAAAGVGPTSPVWSPTVTPSVPASLLSARGTIDTPTEGADVKQCGALTGTAQLPEGATLILAMRNVSSGDPIRYVEYTFNWSTPHRSGPWRGVQFFGTGNSSVGQTFEIQLIAVELADAVAADEIGDDDAANALVTRGQLLDSIEFHRIPGPGDDCEYPSET